MSDSNPFQSPAIETVSTKSVSARRQLGLCRLGVVVVMVVSALLAVGHCINGAMRLAWAIRSQSAIESSPVLAPLSEMDRTIRSLELRHALRSLVSGVAWATFAVVLFRYSRRLHRAAAGSITLDETQGAQAACWLTAAVLSLGYLVGQYVSW